MGERLCTQGRPLTDGESCLDTGGALVPQRRAQDPASRRHNRVTRTVVGTTTLHGPASDACPQVCAGASCLMPGHWRSGSGAGSGLAAQRQPAEAGLWPLRVHWEEAWARQRQGTTAEAHKGGAGPPEGSLPCTHTLSEQDAPT